MSKTYALLVGINDYAPASGVKKLEGCLNDVDHFHAWLKSSIRADELDVLVLKDAQATRAGIIAGFRTHLGNAAEGDVAVFHYCGHGARSASAPEFREYFPVGKDEGLVCVDSRIDGVPDLVDKELAVLIAEVAAKKPHITILLDCCHSGSGTRSADKMRGMRTRATYEVTTERALDTYLDGHYARLKAQGLPLTIPSAPHMLLAACERNQEAQESQDDDNHSGVFTSTLCAVLGKSDAMFKDSGEALTYAELFVRCRAAVRSRADNQNPQFEAIGNFDALSGFLGRPASASGMPYKVTHEADGWKLNCGAIHGLPTDPDQRVTLVLYPEDAAAPAASDAGGRNAGGGSAGVAPVGRATAIQVGMQQSVLKLDFEGDTVLSYRAEISRLPVPPLLVAYEGSADLGAALETALGAEAASPVALTTMAVATDYAIGVAAGQLQLVRRTDKAVIAAIALDATEPVAAAPAPAPAAAIAYLLRALRHVAAWERSLALANPATAMDETQIGFEFFCAQRGDFPEAIDPAGEFVVEIAAEGQPVDRRTAFKFVVTNTGDQLMHAVLAYYSPDFGVEILCNEPIGEDGVPVTIYDSGKYGYVLDPGQTQSIENYKLFVSTEAFDGFLLAMPPLATAMAPPKAATMRGVARLAEIYTNEWFTRNGRVRLIRRVATTGTGDVAVAGGKIVIKGNDFVTANIATSAVLPPTRGAATTPDFHRALERQGLKLLDFGGGDNILELTGIANSAALKENPLRIEIDATLVAANEAILPLVWDGKHVMFAGDTFKDADGTTQISIDALPPGAVNTRSLLGAAKMYIFKTYLGADNVNALRWIDYAVGASDSEADRKRTFKYVETGIKEKVAGARNILLLVHGIVGDTEGMAAGVKACGVADQFDLVLTYDYESLNTLIGDTALKLQQALADVDLVEGHGKRLTLLVHSMGGLVSRWFIERKGGNKIVDHLVMCGTPNNGSPFGKIDGARKIAKLLTTLAINYLPPLVVPASFLLFLLNRSPKVTKALEQMNRDSDFITTLNGSTDPGLRYTILAGDVGHYEEPSDAFFAQLVTKVGHNDVFELLFAQQPNDIAVGVDSILGVGVGRATVPAHTDVACHHLNYFDSANGQAALRSVAW